MLEASHKFLWNVCILFYLSTTQSSLSIYVHVHTYTHTHTYISVEIHIYSYIHISIYTHILLVNLKVKRLDSLMHNFNQSITRYSPVPGSSYLMPYKVMYQPVQEGEVGNLFTQSYIIIVEFPKSPYFLLQNRKKMQNFPELSCLLSTNTINGLLYGKQEISLAVME